MCLLAWWNRGEHPPMTGETRGIRKSFSDVFFQGFLP
jgi:hypothetical protein